MKINKTRLVEIIKEELDNMHDSQNFHDSEGRMAKSQLLQIAEYATFLHNSLKDEDQLEAWVQSKITLAKDYMAKVKHYLEYEMDLPDSSTFEPNQDAEGFYLYKEEDDNN